MPRLLVIQSARNAQIITGANSVIFLGRKDSHSKANMIPATGVPNTAPKPAATAALKKMLSSLGESLNQWKKGEESEADSCNAVPSLPAEPPVKWVINVPVNTSGAINSEMGFPLRFFILANTHLFPLSASLHKRLYKHTLIKPPNGKRQIIHGLPFLKLVTISRVYKKNADAKPASMDTTRISVLYFIKYLILIIF